MEKNLCLKTWKAAVRQEQRAISHDIVIMLSCVKYLSMVSSKIFEQFQIMRMHLFSPCIYTFLPTVLLPVVS